MNRVCSRCGVNEEGGNFHPNPIQDMCHECCVNYPCEDIGEECPEYYKNAARHQAECSARIFARRKTRVVRQRVEGLPAEQCPVWKYDATRLDEIIWPTKKK